METNFTSRMQAAQTAQQRLDLLHQFIAEFTDLSNDIEPDFEDESAFLDSKIKIGCDESDFETSFEMILSISGCMLQWRTVNEKVLPLRIEDNPLFLLRYARILTYMKKGYVEYDSDDEFFYKLYDICLDGTADLLKIRRCFTNEEYFAKGLSAALNETANATILSDCKKELKESVEAFKKSYSKSVEAFYPNDYAAQTDRLKELKLLLEKCQARHKTYYRYYQIPIVKIVADLLMSKNKSKFEKAKKEYANIEEILSGYRKQAEKDRLADFENAVKTFSEQKEAELQKKAEDNRITVDMDKVLPVCNNFREHMEEFFARVTSISELIDEIRKKDFYMLPESLFETAGYEALTKTLPGYITSGKVASLQEAVERYFLEVR